MSGLRSSLLQPRHLEAIVAVAEAGSVHAASRALDIPQPALSRIVASAEEMLGVRVFERSRSGTRVTEAGRRVLKQASFALRALSSVNEAASEQLPVVRVGCIPRVMHTIVPHLLSELSDGTAGFRMLITVGTSAELAVELEAARLDFVIARQVHGAADAESVLVAERLYNEKTVVVCGRGTPLGAGAIRPVAEVIALQWVLPKRGHFSRDLLDKLVADEGLPPIVPIIETNSFESSLSVVAATRFASIAPEFAARRFERLRLVRIVQTRPTLSASPVMLQFDAKQRANPAFAPFRAAAMKAARTSYQAGKGPR